VASFRVKFGKHGVQRITLVETVGTDAWTAHAAASDKPFPPGEITLRVVSGATTGQAARAKVTNVGTHLEVHGTTPFAPSAR
jgi:hypothetical protein